VIIFDELIVMMSLKWLHNWFYFNSL